METERTFTLEQNIKLAEMEGRGQVLLAEKRATLDKRRHARSAWEGDARKRNQLRSNLETEPKFIADTIQRLTTLVHEMADLQSASETGSALAGWTIVEKTWPSRRDKLETEIAALDKAIEEFQAEEEKLLKQENKLQKDIEAIQQSAAKIIG